MPQGSSPPPRRFMDPRLNVSPGARVAACQDVIEQCFVHYDPVKGRGDMDVLAKCARVSRAFFKPAVKLLWEDLARWDRILYVLWKSYDVSNWEVSGAFSRMSVRRNNSLSPSGLPLLKMSNGHDWNSTARS